MKRLICVLLVLFQVLTTAFAEEEQPKTAEDSKGGWFRQAWEDTSSWVSQAWEDASGWTLRAWDDSTKWVSQAWTDSSKWTATTWNRFVTWVHIVSSGNPYSWINHVVLDHGILAFDEFTAMRSFLNREPGLNEIHNRYNQVFSELSLLNEDKDILWNMLQEWTDEKGLNLEQTSKLALPFLVRLLIEGESVIGEQVEFSGPVVGQYLLTILEAMDLDSVSKSETRLKILHASLESLTRPTIIGDTYQNTLVTDDHYYIENFSYLNGKYQIIMIASKKDDASQFPMMRGETLKQTAQKYFKTAEFGEDTVHNTENGMVAKSIPFSYVMADATVTGKATTIWARENYYLFFVLSDQEWSEEEFANWFSSLSLTRPNSIGFEVDIASDGAFYGVNQAAQKYTINRIFDEARFSHPKSGHGWAAERGNNLVDNLKGIIKGRHSTVIGDSNAKDGADRLTTFSDGSRLLIQTKYYSTASRSIASCFDESGFRYMDHVEGKPMAIEVPADQYMAALEYMKRRIANGDVPGVSDVERASEIVKKGNLTYQQARHIAKAGTVESILYDSAHACVTATTSMGISAAVTFAVNLWNGESVEASIKESLLQGLKTSGTSFIVSVLSSQVAKSGINTAMIPASKVVVRALGPKVSAVIVNAFRPAGSAIYGAAAMQSAAKLLRGNVITSTITFVVLSAADVADIIQGRISWKQLAKNVSTTAAGIAGGFLGYFGGAALGNAILPGPGTAVGIIFAIATGFGASEGAKAVANLIAEDDANALIRIIETQFSEIATEYFLNEDEVNQSIENLQGMVTAEMLKQMYQFRDHNAFARQLIEMAIDPVVAQRDYVDLPSEDEYSDYLSNALQAIYEDISGETATD